jgi:superfamily II DNA or RNA helicase
VNWPHQDAALDKIDAAIGAGERKIVVTIPTGGGKTRAMLVLAKAFLDMGKRVVLYTNRRMLLDQTSDVLIDARMDHGIRAAGYDADPDQPFQVASIQTEHSRVVERKRRDLHPADLVLVDEAHVQKERMAVAILQRHVAAGAVVVGFTATPLDLGGFYTHLIVAATMKDLRACGAVVPAVIYGPDEPDFREFKKLSSGKETLKVTENDARRAVMTPSIFGRVWQHFEEYNPRHLPSILFAAGVNESLWFAEQFTAKGVRAAHIDGEHVWLDGQLYPTGRDIRDRVLAMSKAGEVVVLCNRFVLREGIDAPWLRHAILPTIYGSLQTYLQSLGRVLRADNDPETIARFGPKEQATIQDHGGHWWRFGSPNEDREWFLDQTADMAYGIRADRIRNRKKDQPFLCPRCKRAWTRGRECRPAWGGCGYVLPQREKHSRPVVGSDGALKLMTGDILLPRRISRNPNGPDLWKKMYYRSLTEKGCRTFRAAATLFARENKFGWPNPNWPLMPTVERDWWLLVRDVPVSRLRGDPQLLEQVRRFREKRGGGLFV